MGAYHLKKPVKITLTREESLKLSTKRHAYKMDYRLGVNAEGIITAVEAKLLSDAGPYTALSPRVIDQACIFSCGPYRVKNLSVEGWAVHTNNANGSAFRGFGINQAAVAIETLLDEAARKLGLDPFEIRLRNVLEAGDKTISGEILTTSVAMKETVLACQRALQEELPALKASVTPGKRLGIGVAGGFKNVGAGKGKVDDAGAIFSLQPDGRILLRASAVDMGQGIRTALVQIAAEALGVPDENIDLITGETALTIKHGGAVGERQTLIAGKAVQLAAEQFKEKLAAPRNPGDNLETAYYYVAPKTYALADKEARLSVPPEEYRNYPAYAYTTQAAVVEVDEATGKVEVKKVIAAHDCGRAINPVKIEGQIEGSCLQGIGYALSEEYVLKEGIPQTRNFRQLKVPTILETPEIKCLLVEDPEPNGPYGAKGISEVATVPITPAVLNAIADAAGVRIRTLPATPERILKHLCHTEL